MNCQSCGAELKTIPAGISKKTGKSYNAFQACPNNCQQPNNVASYPPYKAPLSSPSGQGGQKDPNWEEISKGKVRHGFAIEAYKKGLKLDSKTANEIIDWTNFVISGKLFERPASLPVIQRDEPTDEDILSAERIPF